MKAAATASSWARSAHPTSRWPGYTLALAAIIVTLAGTALWIVGGRLVAPNPTLVGARSAQLDTQTLRITQLDGPTLAGWFIPGTQPDGAVLLLHGLRADRRQMLGRARFLHAAGYAVLMIDLQAHGETPGTHIGFGRPESRDVRSAIVWLRKRLPDQPIGVIGVSLGGAAALLGDTPVDADALVLESVYSSIEHAVENRLALHLGAVGRHLAPLLLWQIEPRLGISSAQLQPLQAIAKLQSPLLLIAGSGDRRTVLAESLALFKRAPAPKKLWIVAGATHQDLHRHSPQRYEATVLAFLQRFLRGRNPRPNPLPATTANAQVFSQATAAS